MFYNNLIVYLFFTVFILHTLILTIIIEVSITLSHNDIVNLRVNIVHGLSGTVSENMPSKPQNMTLLSYILWCINILSW